MLHVSLNIIEIILGLVFSTYISFKGIKQKNYSKIMLGIAFLLAIISIILHLVDEEFGIMACPTHSCPIIPLIPLSLLFVLFLLLFPKNEKPIFYSFFPIAVATILTILFGESIRTSFVLYTSVPISIVLIIGYFYVYIKFRDAKWLLFFVGQIIFGITGFMSRTETLWTHVIRLIGYFFMFASFEYDSLFNKSKK